MKIGNCNGKGCGRKNVELVHGKRCAVCYRDAQRIFAAKRRAKGIVQGYHAKRFAFVCSATGCQKESWTSAYKKQLHYHSVKCRWIHENEAPAGYVLVSKTLPGGKIRPAVSEKKFAKKFYQLNANTFDLSREFNCSQRQAGEIIKRLKLKLTRVCIGCGIVWEPSNMQKTIGKYHDHACWTKAWNLMKSKDYATFCKRSRADGRRVSLPKKEFDRLKRMDCHYGGKACRGRTMSIDRINPLIHYKTGNCVAACDQHNKSKAYIDGLAHQGKVDGEDAGKLFIESSHEVSTKHYKTLIKYQASHFPDKLIILRNEIDKAILRRNK